MPRSRCDNPLQLDKFVFYCSQSPFILWFDFRSMFPARILLPYQPFRTVPDYPTIPPHSMN